MEGMCAGDMQWMISWCLESCQVSLRRLAARAASRAAAADVTRLDRINKPTRRHSRHVQRCRWRAWICVEEVARLIVTVRVRPAAVSQRRRSHRHVCQLPAFFITLITSQAQPQAYRAPDPDESTPMAASAYVSDGAFGHRAHTHIHAVARIAARPSGNCDTCGSEFWIQRGRVTCCAAVRSFQSWRSLL